MFNYYKTHTSNFLFMFTFRSTKLVIIERLLLLAERYVITIEVGPVFFTYILIYENTDTVVDTNYAE